MLVIVGHGPSVLQAKIGRWIDEQTVVRLKNAPRPDPESWGTRTDYVCSRSDLWTVERVPGAEYWMFQCGTDGKLKRFCDMDRWTQWWARYSSAKPSHGLCAAMCAAEFLDPPEIGVIGFDSMMNPDERMQAKYDRPAGLWIHDQHAEAKALHALGPRIVNLADL